MFKHWPPLNALRGFEAVVRLGNSHKAAEELHLTQSAISQQIRSLEGYLEQPLFLRNERKVSLTDADLDLLGTTQSLLQQLAAGIRRLDQYRRPNQLVVSTTPAFARHWLVPYLGGFHRCHPQVDPWLLTTDEVPEMASQTIDVAVRDDLCTQVECSFRSFLEDRLYPVCHPDLLALLVGRCGTLHGKCETDWGHWQVQGGVDVGQYSAGLNFSDPGLLLEAATQGFGIALVSQLLAASARTAGQSVTLYEQNVRGPEWAWLVYRDNERNGLTRAFCQWLEETIGGTSRTAPGRHG